MSYIEPSLNEFLNNKRSKGPGVDITKEVGFYLDSLLNKLTDISFKTPHDGWSDALEKAMDLGEKMEKVLDKAQRKHGDVPYYNE